MTMKERGFSLDSPRSFWYFSRQAQGTAVSCEGFLCSVA